ncbi:MAG: YhjD/YihY/BrkB family envelope integrity protein, partial [Oscillospiraceae bacterium]
EAQLFEGEAGRTGGMVRIEANYDADSATARMLVTDLGDELARESALRRAFVILDTIREGVLVTDSGNRIISVNPAFTAITGYQAEEAIGRDPAFLGGGTHLPQFYEAMWRSLHQDGSWYGELVNRRKNGERFVESLSITPMRTQDGTISHFVGVFSDITERKLAEADLRELHRELDQRVIDRTAELLRAMSDFLPSAVMSFASDLIEELFGEAGFPVISATAVMLLWSASRGMRGIADGIRKVYGIDSQRSYLVGAIASLFYTLVLVLLLLGSLVVLVFGRTIQLLLSRWIPPLARLLEWVLSRRNIIFFLILAVIFWIGYKGLTGRAFSWRAQLPGALFASGGWLIFSFGYAFYIDHFSHYSVIYGSLTAVVLLMLWLYICMVILLLGAEFNLWLMEFQQK